MTELILLPQPRELTFTSGTHALEAGRRIVLDGAPAPELLFSAQRLQTALRANAGVAWSLSASEAGPAQEIGCVLWVDPSRVAQPEGYELTLTPNTLSIVAHEAAGIFYGVCTLVQILEQAGNSLPCLNIRDHPDFSARGVMLDISRDKVPAMDTLYALVEMLASWKVNQLQLYTEHTFTYRNHPEVWAEASPLCEEEVLELDAFCRRRFVELVPNQNSFGHMTRWLIHERYRPLAELPHGGMTAAGERPEPISLCPTDPRSLELLSSLYDELLPNFTSRMFNVGCDETIDLGFGRSKPETERQGVGRVYLDFLLKIYEQLKRRRHTMQFWGDIILKHPELIPELPKDSIALEWGYEAEHPFGANAEKFAASGVPFYVCPGTSSWNSIAGRTDNARANLLNAAENGLRHGALGYLNTDWGDNGHWQFLPVSYLGFAYGAALAWCVQANRELDLPAALDRFAFRDAAGVMGRAAYALGNVYRSLREFHNASGLVNVLYQPHRAGAQALAAIRAFKGVAPDSFERAMDAIAAATATIHKAGMRRSDADLVADEFECAADLLHHACGLGLLAWEDDPKLAQALKRKLRADLKRIVREYERLWLARNREGGLKDSVARLRALEQVYR